MWQVSIAGWCPVLNCPFGRLRAKYDSHRSLFRLYELTGVLQCCAFCNGLCLKCPPPPAGWLRIPDYVAQTLPAGALLGRVASYYLLCSQVLLLHAHGPILSCLAPGRSKWLPLHPMGAMATVGAPEKSLCLSKGAT